MFWISFSKAAEKVYRAMVDSGVMRDAVPAGLPPWERESVATTWLLIERTVRIRGKTRDGRTIDLPDADRGDVCTGPLKSALYWRHEIAAGKSPCLTRVRVRRKDLRTFLREGIGEIKADCGFFRTYTFPVGRFPVDI